MEEIVRTKKISESTIRRLSSYYRVLEEDEAGGETVTNSEKLAAKAHATPAQVRKDLSYFGTFGKRGIGYNVKQLRHEIINILGLNRHWKVVLIGAGNLGHALFSHREFKRREFIMVGIFDIIPEAIGQIWGGIEIMHISELPRITRELGVEIGVIATPASSAQEAADRVVEAGIRGILNFAPRKLNVPNHVTLRNVEMAMEIEGLSYVLSGGRF